MGHIALSFKPEDAPRLTDAFMARLAEEYLVLMGIRNTQFIVVRHHGTDNPHCHIVFNRVDFDGKVISDSNDFKRNERVTKMLKDKYSL
ncbi:relaxase/mobilization nuclease domain-containing protein, partial [Streptococcus gordonii]|nr:relaxase/mobilization nuclease domain-containing protein [Streptococcus gordonii]